VAKALILDSEAANALANRSRFEFDLGARLEVRELDDATRDIWSLYKPDHRVLSVRGDGFFSLGPGDGPAEYRPIASASGTS
jgi:hypothetical protein